MIDTLNVCTFWFDKIGKWDWTQCCAQHDMDYALGNIPKALADQHLEQCVNNVLPFMGTIMFIGVSVFGIFWWNAARKKDKK